MDVFRIKRIWLADGGNFQITSLNLPIKSVGPTEAFDMNILGWKHGFGYWV